MKTLITFFAVVFLLCLNVTSSGQSQVRIGAAGVNEFFYDVKFDPIDGGTIQVGRIGTSPNTDIWLVKLNAANQVVWQNTIVNPAGEDVIYRVKILANGDYLICGWFTTSGAIRGFAATVNRTTGAFNWMSTTSASTGSNSERFYDAIETAQGNIALVGTFNFNPQATANARGLFVLLNSTGAELGLSRSRNNTPTGGGQNEFFNITQLPNNGNLLISGHFWVNNANYNVILIEVNEINTVSAAQNSYVFNINSPINNTTNLNTLWQTKAFTIGGNVILEMVAGQGCCTANFGVQAIYNYNPANWQLNGNLYYHNAAPSSISTVPISATDMIITQTVGGNNFVSRIVNNVPTFTRQITGPISDIYSSAVNNGNLALSGATTALWDGYAFTNTVNVPISGTGNPCVIQNANAVNVTANNLPPVNDLVAFTPRTLMAAFTPTLQNPNLPLTDMCPLPCPPNTTTNVTKCEEIDITLPARSGTTYSWSPSTYLSSTTVQNPVCSAPVNMQYTVTVFDAATNCTNIDIVNVTAERCGCEDSCSWSLTGNSFVQPFNFIGSRNNAAFKIRTNNTQRMVVSATGDVGINTPTPGKLLHVNGEARIGTLPASVVNDRIVFANNSGDLRSLAPTGNTNHYLSGNGTWQTITGGGIYTADQGITQNGSTFVLGDVCAGTLGQFAESRQINMNNQNLYFNSSQSGKLYMGNTEANDGCKELQARLEISSNGLRAMNEYTSPLPSTSGLRFADMTATNTAPIDNKYDGVLSLDEDGDVIWVKACCSGIATDDAKKMDNILTRLTALEKELAETKMRVKEMDLVLDKNNIVVLGQNTPNPFHESTKIPYYIPKSFTKAQIVFTAVNGIVIKTTDITNPGNGVINVFANDLSSGLYTYSLFIDGKLVETKKMVRQ